MRQRRGRSRREAPEWLFLHDPFPPSAARTWVQTRQHLGASAPGLRDVWVEFTEENRPAFWLAWWRALTWSAADYAADSEGWWRARYWWRSLPLWVPLVVLCVLGYGLLYWLRRAAEYERELAEAQQARLRSSAEDLRATLAIREKEVSALLADRDDLLHLLDDAMAPRTDTNAAAPDASEEAEVRRRLAELESQVEAQQGFLNQGNELLRNAEQWERETREPATLGKQLIDKYGSKTRVLDLIHRMNASRAADASAPPEDVSLRRLRRAVGKWVRPAHGGPQAAFSDHSRAAEVTERFSAIDPDFVREFFVLARNGPYRDGEQRRSIRLRPVDNEPDLGDLEVVLEDDAARTLCLRFRRRNGRGVPPLERVGFAISLLLRTVHRDFEDYVIR